MRRSTRLLFLLPSLFLCGCAWWRPEGDREPVAEAEVPAPPPKPFPVPALFARSWVPMSLGERWVYSASWNGIPVGTATVQAVEVREVRGRPALHVTCTVQPNGYIEALYHIRDEISTDIDLETGWPLRFSKHIEEGKRLKDEYIEFDHAGKTATYYQRKPLEGETLYTPVLVMPIPEGVQDPLSCLFQARALPLEVGQEASIPVNTDEKTYATRMKALRRGPVYLANFGDLEGILLLPRLEYEGILPSKGELQMWVEAESRVPLRMDIRIRIGTIAADLVKRRGAPPFRPLPKIPDSERIGRRPPDRR